MENDSTPNIVSFVIRFIQEQQDETSTQPLYRGAIRHIQTDNELAFTCWAEAVSFIQRFVPIENQTIQGDKNAS